MLCPHPFLRPALRRIGATLALLAAGSGLANPLPSPPPVAPSSLSATAPGSAPAAPNAPSATGQEPVLAAARQWVGQQQGLPASAVHFAALDTRLRLTPCPQPLQMDYPFSQSRETVRVRCTGGAPWQLFLRVVAQPGPALPGQAPQAGTAAQPATGTATRPVVVARRLIQRGSLLEAGMLEVVERPTLGLDPLAVGSLQDVDMAEALRDIPAGTVLRSYDLKRALMVRKGQAAMLTVGQGTGFQVTVRVEAQQDGHLGEQIRLKNTESGRLLSGVVTGPNAVRGLQNSF